MLENTKDWRTLMDDAPHEIGHRRSPADLLLAPLLVAAIVLAIAIVGLARAAMADAASISYVGQDGNVHLVSPDGQRSLQLTHDASADSKYRSPSQTDSGRTVAIRSLGSGSAMAFFLDRQGNQVDAWNLPSSGSGLRFAPFSGGQIAPEGNGGTMVYDYFHADGPFNNYFNEVRVGFVAGGGLTNPCAINCHGGYLRPRWLPGTPYAGFINKQFSALHVQSAQGLKTWAQLNDPNRHNIDSFDVARPGGRLVLEVSPDGGGRSGFEFYGFSGAPGSPIGFVCVAPEVAPATAAPRYSPDGTQIAWEGADGVYVADAPVHGPGGVCNLNGRLIAPGGAEPDWGAADVPAPDPGPGPGPGPAPGPNPGPGPNSDPLPDPTIPDPPPVEDAVKKGFTFEIECPEACEARVTGSVDKRTAKRYGLGRKPAVVVGGEGTRASAGTLSVALEFKPKARVKLAAAKKLKLAMAASVRLASGATEKLKGTVTLKR